MDLEKTEEEKACTGGGTWASPPRGPVGTAEEDESHWVKSGSSAVYPSTLSPLWCGVSRDLL